jgi:murein DD-endopeptidase MepM/ murein hydrolase activator NlpD
MLSLLGACADGETDTSATSDVGGSSSTTSPAATSPATTAPATTARVTTVPVTTSTVPEPAYTFPFTGHKVSYGRDHHDYPAIDVFGCGAMVVSPTNGVVDQVRDFDPWDPKGNAWSTRGGKYVSVIGVDGVRYYFAHLESTLVTPGQTVQPGDALGPMGQTGNARNSACHTHFGISWPCPANEWKVRRGKVWPMDYLDAWRDGDQLSPATAVEWTEIADPEACADAIAQPDAVYS